MNETIQPPIVLTNCGYVEGKIEKNYRGKLYYNFLGIPYAKPPLGKARFKDSQPAEPWKEIKNCMEEGNPCYSRCVLTQNIIGSEDCLNLNISTPLITPRREYSSFDKYPVMVYIHGGAFLCGSNSPNMHGPDFLIENDVLLIVINYRTGLLGFLNLEDPKLEVTGNAGIKDIIMALKWIKDNISAFGGNPHNVTIFGNSAGAAAVHYLMLTPLAKGLFHRAIAQSGCVFNCWAQGIPGNNTAKQIAKLLNIDGADEAQMLIRFQETPMEELFSAQEKLNHKFRAKFPRTIGPVIEDSYFLPTSPINIIKNKQYHDVPFLIGYNSAEGMLLQLLEDNIKLETPEDFLELIPYTLGFDHNSEEIKVIAENLRKFYFPDGKINQQSEAANAIVTDIFFLEAIYRTAIYHATNSSSPIYFYRMDLETNLNFFKTLTGLEGKGACHGDELSYIFKTIITTDVEPESIEELSIQRITKLWTNFAKFGDPNSDNAIDDEILKVRWKPFEVDKHYYLNIDKDLTLQINPEKERMAFWQKLFEQAGLDFYNHSKRAISKL